jgi:hypothetical protein
MNIPRSHRAYEADEDRNHRRDEQHDTAGWEPEDEDVPRGCDVCGCTEFDDGECVRCLSQTWPR